MSDDTGGWTTTRPTDLRGMFEYTGQLNHHGRPHGTGTLVYPDGVTVLEGQFDDDASVQVEVTMRKGTQVMYRGQMVNHHMEGEGSAYNLEDGSLKYTGQWSQGKAHGYDTRYYEDVSKYEGQWQHGKRHGEGTLTELGEVCYRGQRKHDKFDGEGERRYVEFVTSGQIENGVVVYSGQFKQGECHGFGRITFPDGETCTSGSGCTTCGTDRARTSARTASSITAASGCATSRSAGSRRSRGATPSETARSGRRGSGSLRHAGARMAEASNSRLI
jgi:hypothetical protein